MNIKSIFIFIPILIFAKSSFSQNGTDDSTSIGNMQSAYAAVMGCQAQTVTWLSNDGKQTCTATTSNMNNGDVGSVSSTTPTGQAEIACNNGTLVANSASCGGSDCQATCVVWERPNYSGCVGDVITEPMKEGDKKFYYSTSEYNGYAVISCKNGKNELVYENPAQTYYTGETRTDGTPAYVNYTNPFCYRTGRNTGHIKYDSCYQGGRGG